MYTHTHTHSRMQAHRQTHKTCRVERKRMAFKRSQDVGGVRSNKIKLDEKSKQRQKNGVARMFFGNSVLSNARKAVKKNCKVMINGKT